MGGGSEGETLDSGSCLRALHPFVEKGRGVLLAKETLRITRERGLGVRDTSKLEHLIYLHPLIMTCNIEILPLTK